MIKKILSKPVLLIKSCLIRQKSKKIYLAHLEADYCRLKIQEEMRRVSPETWA